MKSTDLILVGCQPKEHEISNEAVSSLYREWQKGNDELPTIKSDFCVSSSKICTTREAVVSNPMANKILPDLQKSSNKMTTMTIKKKRKRPLCTFLNFRGTRTHELKYSANLVTDSESSSVPSLDSDDDSSIESQPPTKRIRRIPGPANFPMPAIDATLKDDPKIIEFTKKFSKLVAEIQQVRRKMRESGAGSM